MIKQSFRRLVVARASTGCRVRQYTHCVVASEAFPTSTEQLDFLEAQQERDNSMESAKLIAGPSQPRILLLAPAGPIDTVHGCR